LYGSSVLPASGCVKEISMNTKQDSKTLNRRKQMTGIGIKSVQVTLLGEKVKSYPKIEVPMNTTGSNLEQAPIQY
jgi:hypothetical protein